MKQLYIIIFLCFSNLLYGQNKKIAIGLGVYSFYIPGTNKFSEVRKKINLKDIREIFTSYEVSKKISITASYIYFNNTSLNQTRIINSKLFYDTLSNLPYSRDNYRYIDVCSGFNYYGTKRHKLNLITGVSFSRGRNGYLRQLVLSPDTNFLDIIYSKYEYLKENYFGLIGGLTYNYSLFNDRLSIGLNSNVRFYPKYPIHINYGITVKGKI